MIDIELSEVVSPLTLLQSWVPRLKLSEKSLDCVKNDKNNSPSSSHRHPVELRDCNLKRLKHDVAACMYRQYNNMSFASFQYYLCSTLRFQFSFNDCPSPRTTFCNKKVTSTATYTVNVRVLSYQTACLTTWKYYCTAFQMNYGREIWLLTRRLKIENQHEKQTNKQTEPHESILSSSRFRVGIIKMATYVSVLSTDC